MKVRWIDEIEFIKTAIAAGVTLEKIGGKYNVSRQRMYQITQKYGLRTLNNTRSRMLEGKPPKYHWLARILCHKKVSKADRLWLLETLPIPDVCPILGIKLNYDGGGIGKEYFQSYSRADNSPSLDQIRPGLGYLPGNVQVISWRANRIKNDGTPEELMKIAQYMNKLTKKQLTV